MSPAWAPFLPNDDQIKSNSFTFTKLMKSANILPRGLYDKLTTFIDFSLTRSKLNSFKKIVTHFD